MLVNVDDAAAAAADTLATAIDAIDEIVVDASIVAEINAVASFSFDDDADDVAYDHPLSINSIFSSSQEEVVLQLPWSFPFRSCQQWKDGPR